MATKTSTVPNYYNCKLAFDCLDYLIGTEIGYQAFYDSDMSYIPGVSASMAYGDKYFDEVYNLRYRKASSSIAGGAWSCWATINPFNKYKEISVSYRPIIDHLPTGSNKEFYHLITLGSIGNYNVNITYCVDKDSLRFGIFVGTSGSLPTSYYSSAIPVFGSDQFDAIERMAKMNYILSNARFYISSYNNVNNNSLSNTAYTYAIKLIISLDGNHYCWASGNDAFPGTQSVDFVTIPNETESYIPQPEPEPPAPSDDPYNPGGYSGSGGGPAGTGGTGTTGTGGLHDDTSDTIPTPSLPTDVITGSGLFTAYNPSASQLASFANALWNMQVSDINDVLRFLFGGDAFNAVIGLHLLPVTPSTGGPQNIKLGNWDTNVSAPKITNQYVQVPFGSLLLPEYWGNCIDYAPYTKIQLALPYIGIVDVDTDDVLGSTNTLTYNIDVLSGAICATLHCVKFNLSSVIYQWSGACAVSLPFSGASYNSVLGAIAGIAAAGMGFASIAAGPIGAALPSAALAAGAGAFGAGSAASILGTMKGKVQKSGSFGANSGALGIMTPYFILTRPVQSVPASWQADKGYPANISAQLGTVTGYTEVSEINLECSGTEAEKKEIVDLLKKGVLF